MLACYRHAFMLSVRAGGATSGICFWVEFDRRTASIQPLGIPPLCREQEIYDTLWVQTRPAARVFCFFGPEVRLLLRTSVTGKRSDNESGPWSAILSTSEGDDAFNMKIHVPPNHIPATLGHYEIKRLRLAVNAPPFARLMRKTATRTIVAGVVLQGIMFSVVIHGVLLDKTHTINQGCTSVDSRALFKIQECNWAQTLTHEKRSGIRNSCRPRNLSPSTCDKRRNIVSRRGNKKRWRIESRKVCTAG